MGNGNSSGKVLSYNERRIRDFEKAADEAVFRAVGTLRFKWNATLYYRRAADEKGKRCYVIRTPQPNSIGRRRVAKILISLLPGFKANVEIVVSPEPKTRIGKLLGPAEPRKLGHATVHTTKPAALYAAVLGALERNRRKFGRFPPLLVP